MKIRQGLDWEKSLTGHVSDKEAVYRIYKDLFEFNIKTTDHGFKTLIKPQTLYKTRKCPINT